jgi:hypothetical protein
VILLGKKNKEQRCNKARKAFCDDLCAFLIARQHYPAGFIFGNRFFAPNAYFVTIRL